MVKSGPGRASGSGSPSMVIDASSTEEAMSTSNSWSRSKVMLLVGVTENFCSSVPKSDAAGVERNSPNVPSSMRSS